MTDGTCNRCGLHLTNEASIASGGFGVVCSGGPSCHLRADGYQRGLKRATSFGPSPLREMCRMWEKGREYGHREVESKSRARRVGNVVGWIVFVLVLWTFGMFSARQIDDGKNDVTFRVVWEGRTYFLVKLMPEGEL